MSDATPNPRTREDPIDLSVPRRVHVVGVAGPGMAPLALLLAGRGHVVTGSDVRDSPTVRTLRGASVDVTIGHEATLVDGVDVVVHSTAIPADNPELVRAGSLSIPVRHRSGLIAALCGQLDTIGVAGTHGKSTTTALVNHILTRCGRDPNCLVGAEVPGLTAGARIGGSDLFVVEADESDGSIEVLDMSHLIVTNVDVDHLDYFGTFERLCDTMRSVAESVPGVLVMNSADPLTNSVMRPHGASVRTFGVDPTDDVVVVAVDHLADGLGVELIIDAVRCRCEVPLRGEHNAHNVAAALAMVTALGVDRVDACGALATFPGVSRRFTVRGHHNGALLVDDYAHLPAEIAAAIAAVRTHPEVTGRVVAVFQPNRYHRVAAMADAYADCFAGADRVVITDIYASGTPVIEGVDGQMVWRAVAEANPGMDVVWAPERADVVVAVDGHIGAGDACVSMGCGDIESFPDELLGRHR